MINRQVPGVAVHQSNDATRDIPLGTPVVSGNIIAMPQRPPAEEESEQVYVFGFPVEHMEDDSVVPLMRNVLRISIAAGLLVIVSHGAKYEVNQAEGFNTSGQTIPSLLINIMLGLAVPACGYFGAKNRNRGVLSCFQGWSMASACWGGITIFILMGIVSNGGQVIVKEHDSTGHRPPRETVVQVPMTVAGLALGIALVQVILNLAQFFYARKLLESEYFSPNYGMAAAVEMETTVTQAHQGPQISHHSEQPPAYAFSGQVPQGPVAGVPIPPQATVPHYAQPYAPAHAQPPTTSATDIEAK